MFLTWKFDRNFVESFLKCPDREAQQSCVIDQMNVAQRYPGDDISNEFRRGIYADLFVELLSFAQQAKLDVKQISTLVCLVDELHSVCCDRGFPGLENGQLILI